MKITIITVCFNSSKTIEKTLQSILSQTYNNIEYIVADWTNKDENILKVLNKYGRSGVPLYVFWKPGMQDPIILPAILTENLVLETLNKY